MGDLGDAYAAMQPPRKCFCGESPQGHPSGLCDTCIAKRSAPPAPRRPVAGWVEVARFNFRCWQLGTLPSGDCVAYVTNEPTGYFTCLAPWDDRHRTDTLEAAQLAAEDALRAVLVDAAAALGLRVVP